MAEGRTKEARLSALRQTALLDSPPDERFDRIARIAKASLGVPVVLLSFVDEDRQFFKSCVGLPEPLASLRQTPLTHSFCQYVVRDEAILRVENARRHELVKDNPAIDELGVVAYLGVPVRAPTGEVIGSLCVIERQERCWTEQEESLLRDLCAIAEEQLALQTAERYWRGVLNAVPLMIWSTRPDGYADFYNDRWYEVTGVPFGSTDGKAWTKLFYADDIDLALERWHHSLETGEPYEIEYRLRHKDGQYRWALGRALPILDNAGSVSRWFGICTDIHDIKAAEEERELINKELTHRIRNIFAVVSSLISMSAREDDVCKEFAEELQGRTQALAKAYSRVVPDASHSDLQNSGKQSLHALIRSILAPYVGEGGDVVFIEGPDLQIGLRGATSIALITHELATNAVKYGALSRKSGHIEVETHIEDDTLRLVWRELGGPIIENIPKHKGFGSGVMTRATASQLAGSVEREWDREGLKVIITAAISRLVR